MQLLLRRLILFLSLAATISFMPRKAYATHLAGSDISYTCVGGNNYRVELTFYRDCRGLSGFPFGVGIEFRSASCNRYFTDTLLLVNGSGQEITYPCPGLNSSCDDPNSPNPGIQEYKYSGIVSFPMQCSDWVISWTYCCRNCDITTMVQSLPCTPGNNPAMYISTALDNLNYPCNSSPHFTNNPIVFVCVGQNFTYNHGAIDPDGDSLAYSLVNPLTNATDSIPFVSGYSATVPIMSSPALAINPVTGDITMTPTQVEVGVLSVLVQEYRNGVLIGHVIRDMEIYVQACNNIIPTATGMNGTSSRDTTICPNTQLCFDVFSNDADPGQIVTMTWNSGITGATFNVAGFPYPTGTFCWTPGVNDISSIPHQFTVTVVDNACPNSGYQTYSFNILVNSPLVNINVSNISCNGLTDGSINVVPVNPGSYSYLWSPGNQTTSGISGLGPGTYNVTVFDSTTGCSATFPNTITDPPVLEDSAYVITASCTGTSSGVATVIASGGTPPYNYSWNTVPPTLNDTATGLAAGSYTVTVTDSRGCTSQDSVVVNFSSTALLLTTTSDTLNCFTDTTGVVSVSVSGGTPSYTYSWSTNPPQLTPTATGLSPGLYFITVTDSVGCSETDSAAVISPDEIILTGSATNASCNDSDGVARVAVTGGVPPYAFIWAGFPSVADSLDSIPPGLYNVTVIDSLGCERTLDILVQSLTIASTANGISPVGCSGGSNGSAVATASGGIPPYIFEWNTVPPQFNDTAIGLSAGLYIVTITDSTLCYTVDTVHINNPPVLSVSFNAVDASCLGDSTGSATAIPNGGISPFTYSWSPYGGNAATADSLIPGTYTVSITDSAGCNIIDSVTIQQNSSITVTIDSIIQPNCNGASTGSVFISVGGGSGTYSYLWIPGGLVTEDITGIDAGNYVVTITDQNGCTQQQPVSVGQPQPVPANAGSDTAACGGNSIQLGATPPGPGSTGVWSGPSGIVFSNVNDPSATASNIPGGFNNLTWTVTDSNGCSSSDVVVIFNFSLNIDAGPSQDICGLVPVQLNATSIIGFTGFWSASSNVNFDDTSANNATVTFNTYGVEVLTWTVSNAACSGSDDVTIGMYEMPGADAGSSRVVCASEVELEATSSGPGTGSWFVRLPSTASVLDPSDPTTNGINLPPGDTTVFIWTMTNGPCLAADTVNIYYDESCELELPSAFSPNGDTYNDGYEIKGIEGYPENIFRVFNRWGNEVYVRENYKNTDWMGQNKSGDDLPEGTYFVILEISSKNIQKNTFVDLRRYLSK